MLKDNKDIQAVLDLWPYKNDDDLNRLAEIYKAVFGEILDIKCPNCRIKAHHKLSNQIQVNNFTSQQMATKNSKYKFKDEFKGSEVLIREKGLLLTEDSLTDELGDYIMKNHPEKVGKFIELVEKPTGKSKGTDSGESK